MYDYSNGKEEIKYLARRARSPFIQEISIAGAFDQEPSGNGLNKLCSFKILLARMSYRY